MEPIIKKNAPAMGPPLSSQSNNFSSSSKWSKNNDSMLLLPTNQLREHQRKEILLAVKEGRLGIREIIPEKERTYLEQKNKEPRPVCWIQHGVPISTRSSHINVLGILNPEMLAVYKDNAMTRDLVGSGLALDELDVKCLSDGHALQKKMGELAERRWDVYPGFTSGHLQPDGTFTQPKSKPYCKERHTGPIPYPELVTTGYEKAQIKCYCIRKEDASGNITDILQEKRTLEKTLGMGPLPLAVYCPHSGSLEVFFDEELEGNQLAQNEARLDELAVFHNMEPRIFRGILSILPMTLKSESLNKIKLKAKPPRSSTLNELIEMVSNPSCYNPERLQVIKDSGFSFNERFYFKEKFTTLIDLFIDNQRTRFDAEKYNFDNLKEKADIYSSSKKKAKRLFHDLISSGATTIKTKSIDLGSTPPYLCNYLVARLTPEKIHSYPLSMIHPIDFPAIKVAIDRICRVHHSKLNSFLEYALYRPFTHLKHFAFFRHHLLTLFYYGAVPNKEILAATNQEIRGRSDKKIQITLGNSSADDYIQWVQELYRQREQDPFYQSWPAQVEEAKQEIAKLKASLDLQTKPLPPISEEEAYDPSELQFVVDAFSKPPVLAHARDNEETILKILQHYYRRPGPERVIENLRSKSLPTVWKPLHACSHVLRARNNALWYMELLEKFQSWNFTEDEKTLLALAAIYHDAAAEDVGKDREEKRSAEYFKRDLAGQYPQTLLDDIALALESKENDIDGLDDDSLTQTVRGYLRVLRFADRMDIIRCTGVEKNFPGLTGPHHPDQSEFNGSLLDLPPKLSKFTSDPEKKSLFQRNLEAAMHGAADLARVTGHLHHDHRTNPYAHSYRLTPETRQLTEQFEHTTMPVGKIDDFINDNVRRKIARLADIHTCSDPSHRKCGTDSQQGITRGIHNSWYDLRQIRIPECMTRLEKMQLEHGDMDVLSEATRQAITAEVQRLKLHGIPMNLGTLTQETLRSRPAKRKLEHRGLSVVSEKRLRGYDEGGNARFEEMLVPKYSPGSVVTAPANQ